MPYLMIENKGVAPKTAFCVLGATTKRESTIPGIIGTFGSGSNMGTLNLLRQDINPIVYCGTDSLTFSTKTLSVKDVAGNITDHRQVFVKHGGSSKKTEKLSWVLAYGENDWTDIAFSLREYVSNAIDAMITQKISPEDVRHFIRVEIVEDNQVRGKSDYTRVFVPVTPEVTKFVANLSNWFLHFEEPELLNQVMLPKCGRNLKVDGGIPTKRAVIYRRGVRVREFESDNLPSLFDYNLNDLRINESRNVNDWIIIEAVGVALQRAEPEILSQVLRAVSSDKTEQVWESKLSEYGLNNYVPYEMKEKISNNWKTAMKAVAGENAVIVASDANADFVKRKGYTPVQMPAAFAIAAMNFGVTGQDKVLTEDDKVGRTFSEPTEALLNTLDRIWNDMVKYGMHGGKEKPACKMFFEQMNAECEKFGYYKDNTIFVHQDYATAENDALDLTVIEECGRFITSSLDNSRDFQQFFIRFLQAVLKNK